jgi:hypothetical protein
MSDAFQFTAAKATAEAPFVEDLAALRDRLRAGQQALADWSGGPLAVSAVPGAGKSTGMAAAAAIAIARYGLNAKRQLVLVTFTRSAAANLKAKVQGHLRDLKLPFRCWQFCKRCTPDSGGSAVSGGGRYPYGYVRCVPVHRC